METTITDVKKIKLITIADLMDFINTTSSISGEVLVATEGGNTIVNGKSLLGVMSLNIMKPLIVTYPAEEYYYKDFLNRFSIN